MFRRFKESLTCVKEGYIAIIIIFIISIAGFSLLGQVYSDTVARELIGAMLPALQTLSFAVITSAATVISLMMAVLGFARRMENEFDHDFYLRIWFIATIATVALVISALLLLLITIPMIEADALQTWYSITYWVLVVITSSLMALLVGMIISLYRTLFSLISISAPSWD
ncbi:MAG: hypothetical protein WBC91_05820 [Phototrophicaceae bacterium]